MFCADLLGAYANKASQHLAETVQGGFDLDYGQARQVDAFVGWLLAPRRYLTIR